MACGWEPYHPHPTPLMSLSDRERVEFRDSNKVLIYLVGEARRLFLLVLSQERDLNIKLWSWEPCPFPAFGAILNPELSLLQLELLSCDPTHGPWSCHSPALCS